MQDHNAQSKKPFKALPWVLLAGGLIALIVFLINRFDKESNDAGDNVSSPVKREAVAATGDAPPANSIVDGWGNVNHQAPSLNYPELQGSKEIRVTGTEDYAVYDLGEDILFDADKSAIRAGAAGQLKAVATSIQQRFANGPIRLYGFTDAEGSEAFNKELAASRAEAVRNWLVNNERIAAERITIEAVGEDQPVASNQTESGRRKNRRVQIVVRQSALNK